MEDTTAVNSIQFILDPTDFSLTTITATDFNIQGFTDLRMRSGTGLSVNTADNAATAWTLSPGVGSGTTTTLGVTGNYDITCGGGSGVLNLDALMDITGTLTLNAANALVIQGPAPDIRIFEDDATADEGNWLVRAQTDQFRIASATDAAPSTAVENAIIIARSGSGIGAIDFQTTLLRLNDSSFRIDGRGSAAASFLDIRIDNSAAQRSFIELFNDANVNVLDMRLNTGDSIQFFDPRTSEIWLQHVTSSDVRIRDGLSFRIYDSGDTDFADFSHDGADFIADYFQTAIAQHTGAGAYSWDSYMQLPTSTDAALNAIANAINTDPGKIQGAMLYNTDQDLPVYATGNTDGAVWVDGNGDTVNTPII